MPNETENKYEDLMKIGEGAFSVIAEMVAALECDYDRLEELRDALIDRHDDESGGEASGEFEAWVTGNAAGGDEDCSEFVALREAAGECSDRDEAEQRIREDALSVEVRSDWHSPGSAPEEPGEFCILLSTGGPAVRIMGELDGGEPSRAWLEVQDWGTPWTHYTKADQDTLLTYARCFYFGD